jgi:hypothetical protein
MQAAQVPTQNDQAAGGEYIIRLRCKSAGGVENFTFKRSVQGDDPQVDGDTSQNKLTTSPESRQLN